MKVTVKEVDFFGNYVERVITSHNQLSFSNIDEAIALLLETDLKEFTFKNEE